MKPRIGPSRAEEPPAVDRSRWGRAVAFVLLSLFSLSAIPGGAADQAGGTSPSAEKVCDAYWSQRYDDALTLASQIVGSETAEPGVKVDAYKCQACAYVAVRKVEPARASIAEMLRLDSTARFTPDYDYPPPVIDLYHAVRDSLGGDAHGGTIDIRTVAVGDFEDNSIYKGKYKDYDFSAFRLALVHTIMADLAQATPLKIVDRQRTDELMKEIQLGQSGFTSSDQAVRFGQLLGAQSFIFGQYMILSKDTVRIDARLVHTATGEVILAKQVTGNFGGDPKKFLKMEQDLVQDLAKGLGEILAGSGEKVDIGRMTASYFEQKSAGIGKRKGYVESKFLISEALAREDGGDYRGAQSLWRKVLDIDPGNEIAGRRVQVLVALVEG